MYCCTFSLLYNTHAPLSFQYITLFLSKYRLSLSISKNSHYMYAPPLSFCSRTHLFSLKTNHKIVTIFTIVGKLLASISSHALQALIFFYNEVILESENLHHQIYNDAFTYFNIRHPSSFSSQI